MDGEMVEKHRDAGDVASLPHPVVFSKRRQHDTEVPCVIMVAIGLNIKVLLRGIYAKRAY